MAGHNEELGLSLSLSFSSQSRSSSHHHLQQQQQQPLQPPPLQLNLMMMPSRFLSSRSSPSDFASPDRSSGEPRPSLKGIDVNRLPETVDLEEEAGVSSPNSTISTVSGKRSASERELTNGEDLITDNDRSSSRGIVSDEEDGDNSRKKLRLSKDQSAILEETFKEHNTLNPRQKLALAKQLGLRPRQVEVWFQNRRARTKLKQTEVDCEFLKRCCENLTEENRRLQKEVMELRALKLISPPQFYMAPATTLTMCPSCEHVAGPRKVAVGPAHLRAVPADPWAATGRVPLDALRPRP